MNNDKKHLDSLTLLFIYLMIQALFSSQMSNKNLSITAALKKMSFLNPPAVEATGISSASATLSNPRLSFHGLANATITAGDTIGVVKSSGAGGDYDTRNLFPGDSIVITGNSPIIIASTSSDLVTFMLKTAVGTTAAADSNMTVAQGGTLKVQIFTASDIPVGGSIKISVPAPNELVALTTDGIPLAESSLVNSGFDTNGMTNANITCPGSFTAGTFTAGASGTPHTFTCNYTGVSALAAGTPLTITIGDTSKPLINPAPISGLHTRGVADSYGITAGTYTLTNGSGVLLQEGIMKVAPVDGVLVSASVDETLTFTVAGVAAGSGTYCGKTHTAGITTTATSVPWGTINSGYAVDSNEAVQQLTVSTNAASGYKVYAEENDQMGLEGVACVGSSPSVEPFTFSGPTTCIKDVSVGSISHTVAADWGTTPGSNYGFGYSLQNSSGTDASFLYNTSGVYDAKQFADQEASEDKYATGAELMTNTGPVNASSVYVCYRINIPGTQPAGYYYSKIKYTAVAKF